MRASFNNPAQAKDFLMTVHNLPVFQRDDKTVVTYIKSANSGAFSIDYSSASDYREESEISALINYVSDMNAMITDIFMDEDEILIFAKEYTTLYIDEKIILQKYISRN